MPVVRLRLVPVLACLVSGVAAPARPQPADSFQTTHIRPEAILRPLVADAIRRSETVRDLVERLERSDVTVYVRMRALPDSTTNGRLMLLSRTTVQRFVVVELACGRSWVDQIAMLGHELRHALEVADAPAIVDARTMIAHYRRIGIRTNPELSFTAMFETDDAVRSGRRVLHELMAKGRTTDGS